MNIKCLFGHHIWRFAYHHGMPLGVSTDVALRMIKEGKIYAVDCCTRSGCDKQSRVINGERVMLRRDEIEDP